MKTVNIAVELFDDASMELAKYVVGELDELVDFEHLIYKGPFISRTMDTIKKFKGGVGADETTDYKELKSLIRKYRDETTNNIEKLTKILRVLEEQQSMLGKMVDATQASIDLGK